MRRLGLILMLLCVAGTAWSQGAKAVREQAEASLLVTATIDIEPDGRVSGYRIDRPEALPSYAVELLERRIPSWRFEPVKVDGVAVPAQAPANIRLVARKTGDDEYAIRIAAVSFQPRNSDRGKQDLRPPGYPATLAKAGVGGTVYLIAKVRADGTVEDAFAEQVNLQAVTSERVMAKMRHTLARVSVAAARRWTLKRPGDVTLVDGCWLVRIPVDFIAPGKRHPEYGEWQAYIPGPRDESPWARGDDVPPDTLLAGGMYPVQRRGPRLVTPLESGEG
ncbi:protein tonB [Marilutibacter spongiae]|uniref:Protein tonB n=1 Tax=Marilutibacter spongiae TaxID=2025720 RepID=A0A7W3TKP6_9GAMM|nr:protein tonB [Lysobacter spongiae]MBB1059859.1 protein tonB [Lysobacter spongiae]